MTAETFLTRYERPANIPAGNVLFNEGDEPEGVYLVHDGEFDLVFASRLGDSRPLRSANSGQILGLSCVVSNRPHDCSATAKTASTVGFIPKEDFKKLLD
ncbi:MAG TPA: cyclic nucleotide-binding domain-containing protein, partial [Thermoanaerobaculia bacterium]|nr:cyclic nucleotide-binding domain-containing protein [Thermoanaerobaculia bacterium]